MYTPHYSTTRVLYSSCTSCTHASYELVRALFPLPMRQAEQVASEEKVRGYEAQVKDEFDRSTELQTTLSVTQGGYATARGDLTTAQQAFASLKASSEATEMAREEAVRGLEARVVELQHSGDQKDAELEVRRVNGESEKNSYDESLQLLQDRGGVTATNWSAQRILLYSQIVSTTLPPPSMVFVLGPGAARAG